MSEKPNVNIILIFLCARIRSDFFVFSILVSPSIELVCFVSFIKQNAWDQFSKQHQRMKEMSKYEERTTFKIGPLNIFAKMRNNE